MADDLRFLHSGQDGILVEIPDLETALTLHDKLRADALDGVIDIVTGAQTLLLTFDGRVTETRALIDHIRQFELSERKTREGETVEIPVSYEGADLDEVAQLLGWSVPELIRRHCEATYTVAFTGFAPGFVYMTSDDPALVVPRRTSPRTRIPAGSVALGGRFGGIYPSDSPGGWQLIGHTTVKMWDSSRSPPALLAPGQRVHFRNTGNMSAFTETSTRTESTQARVQAGTEAPGLLVTRADRPALFQDLGRPGYASQGVTVSGALDRFSLTEANLSVGNGPNAAAIEIVYGGFAVKTNSPATLAVTGAPAKTTIAYADGRTVRAPAARPIALNAGEELVLDAPQEGTHSYLAIRGGFEVHKTLGSASTDTLARIGPAAIREGDFLAMANHPCAAVDPFRPVPQLLPMSTHTVTLDVVPGPRFDWFTPQAQALLLEQTWQVTSETSRVGARLRGEQRLSRKDMHELPSEGTCRGSIQVPHSGQPVLFLADHPLTGGYPVIAVVARHHLDLAAQVPIGAKIRFRAIANFAPGTKDHTS